MRKGRRSSRSVSGESAGRNILKRASRSRSRSPRGGAGEGRGGRREFSDNESSANDQEAVSDNDNIGGDEVEGGRHRSRERGSRYQEKHRSSGGNRDRRRRGESREGDRYSSRKDYRSPRFSEHFLLPYKDFCQQQRQGLSRDDLADLYDKYKSDYEIYHAEVFFKEHHDDCWFRERYDPESAL